MSDNIVIEANERDGLGGSLQLQANKRGDLYTVKGLPDFTYLVNAGYVWRAKSAATACVIAVPTTASIFTLQNTEGEGGKSYVIIDLFAMNVVADAFVQPAHIIYVVNGARVANQAASVVPWNAKARSPAYAGSAILAAPGANVVDTGWFPACNSTVAAIASLPGQGIYARMDGLIILPPGGLMGVSVYGADVTFTYHVGATWAEVQL
jgi:hypothetical protein